MRKLPPLNALKAFEAAARLKSFTAAARELGVTHGAISRQVRILEQFSNVRLFTPVARGVALTEPGTRFSTEIGASLDRIAAATEKLVEPWTNRLVRIDAYPTFTFFWLFPRLAEFQRRHPNVETRPSASIQRIAELSTMYDVIVRRYPMTREGYKCVHLLDDFGAPVCAPDLLRENPIEKPKDLLKHTLLFTETHAGKWQEWLSQAGVAMPRKRLKFEHFHVLIQAALEGLGVALGPQVLVEEEIKSGRLVAPFQRPRVPFDAFYMLYRVTGPNKDRAKIFADWLIEEARTFQRDLGKRTLASPPRKTPALQK